MSSDENSNGRQNISLEIPRNTVQELSPLDAVASEPKIPRRLRAGGFSIRVNDGAAGYAAMLVALIKETDLPT